MLQIHGSDRATVNAAVRQAVELGSDYEGEFRVVLPNGMVRWIAARGRTESAPDAKPSRFFGATVDITERKLMEEAARDLSGRLIGAQEAERARLAAELHDGINQSLALLAVELEMFSQRLPENSEQIQSRLECFSTQTKALSAEVHRISHGLHPVKLKQLGLEVALRGFCREVEAAHPLVVRFAARDVPRELPEKIALCLYRVTQEAIQNVVRHSGAKSATVDLQFREPSIELKVVDDGKGFEVISDRQTSAIGLVSMQERARQVEGVITVKSKPGKGTQVEVRVPLRT